MSQPSVALFITCLTDQFQPRVGVAMVKVLEKLGWRVAFPAEQTCCGQPFLNNGFEDEARRLARRRAALSILRRSTTTASAAGSVPFRPPSALRLPTSSPWA